MQNVTVFPDNIIEPLKQWVAKHCESNLYQVALNINLMIMFHDMEAVQDLQSFIEWAELSKVDHETIVETVNHDFANAQNPDCVLRSSGYTYILAEELLTR